jgi:hypothetical protein
MNPVGQFRPGRTSFQSNADPVAESSEIVRLPSRFTDSTIATCPQGSTLCRPHQATAPGAGRRSVREA